MDVHWLEKHLSFQYKGQRVHLQGARSTIAPCKALSAPQLQRLVSTDAVQHIVHICALEEEPSTEQETPIPSAITEVLAQFSTLFQEASGLPPSRPFDHTIPLIPGAQPVNLRPYRYTPAQKDEIDHQIKEMLQHGVIRQSISPFASPVLLVQKKDGT